MHRLLLALAFLASCTPADSATDAPEPSSKPAASKSLAQLTAGQLYGVMQTREGLTLQLASGGCRQASDVTFAVDAGELVITNVTFDSCEAYIPLGDTVLFPWSSLPTFTELRITTDPAPVLEPGKAPGPTKAPAGTKDEWIYGAIVKADGIDVRVWSGGCTSPEHFTSWIEPGDTPDAQLVHLVRTQQDRCEAEQPEGALLHFTWQDLGVTKQHARLANPIITLPQT